MVTDKELDLMIGRKDVHPAAAIEAFIELKDRRKKDPPPKPTQGYLKSIPTHTDSEKEMRHSGEAKGSQNFYLKCDSARHVYGISFSGIEGDGMPISRFKIHINKDTTDHRCITDRQFHRMSFGRDPWHAYVESGDEIMVEAMNCSFSFVTKESE